MATSRNQTTGNHNNGLCCPTWRWQSFTWSDKSSAVVNSVNNPSAVVGTSIQVIELQQVAEECIQQSRNWLDWVIAGDNWKVLQGVTEGQTQSDTPRIGPISNWNHPLDVHWATRGLRGWPRLHMQIFHLDSYSGSNLIGYASVSLPTRPGIHSIEVAAWRPLGNRLHPSPMLISFITYQNWCWNQERSPRSWCAISSAEASNWPIVTGSTAALIDPNCGPCRLERSTWNSAWYSATSSGSESIINGRCWLDAAGSWVGCARSVGDVICSPRDDYAE